MGQSQPPASDAKLAVARIARELRRHLIFQAQLAADGAPRATADQLAELDRRIARAELDRDRAAFTRLGRQGAADRPAPSARSAARPAPPTPAAPPAAPLPVSAAPRPVADAPLPAPPSPQPPPAPRPALVAPAPRPPADPTSPYKIVDLLNRTNRPARVEAPPADARAAALHQLREELGDCRRCRLCETRTQIVFGHGSPAAELVFIGEAPGRGEDERGEPFVGRSGELLNRMVGAMKLRREDIYVCNIVKCRPPGNRDPNPDELEACAPFLASQLEALSPRVIVTLGADATQALLRTDAPLARLRGQWHHWRGIPVMPTYHPAFVLRNPAEKRPVWDDLKKVMAELGKPV